MTFRNEPRVRKAVLPVAGRCRRLLPATRTIPNEMVPVVDKPLIEYAVEEAVRAGIEQIVFVTTGQKSAIEDHFEGWQGPGGIATRFAAVRQSAPRGLGDAILQASELIGAEPFAVLLPDDLLIGAKPAIAELIETYVEKHASVIAVEPIAPMETGSYGVIEPRNSFGGRHAVADIVEKPGPDKAPSLLGVIGRYVLCPSIFRALRETPEGAGGELQLTDALRALAREEDVWAIQPSAMRIDCGSRAGMLRAQLEVALRDPALRDVVHQWARGLVFVSQTRPASSAPGKGQDGTARQIGHASHVVGPTS